MTGGQKGARDGGGEKKVTGAVIPFRDHELQALAPHDVLVARVVEEGQAGEYEVECSFAGPARLRLSVDLRGDFSPGMLGPGEKGRGWGGGGGGGQMFSLTAAEAACSRGLSWR